MRACACVARRSEINVNRGSRMVLVIILVLALDQLSKYLVSSQLSLHQSIPLIPSVFSLTLVHNRGAAFGILKGHLWLLIAVTLGAIALLVTTLRQRRLREKMTLTTWALCLILSGAAGNLIDRLLHGYVIDFFDLHVWPVFNVADSAISVGAVLLSWSLFRGRNTQRS